MVGKNALTDTDENCRIVMTDRQCGAELHGQPATGDCQVKLLTIVSEQERRQRVQMALVIVTNTRRAHRDMRRFDCFALVSFAFKLGQRICSVCMPNGVTIQSMASLAHDLSDDKAADGDAK
ncbi:MAG: hypothetical protein H6823_26860 [Planctomycetaceae bacterium]|nr:hypothetical protein [Planctomycetaceae bacterium]